MELTTCMADAVIYSKSVIAATYESYHEAERVNDDLVPEARRKVIDKLFELCHTPSQCVAVIMTVNPDKLVTARAAWLACKSDHEDGTPEALADHVRNVMALGERSISEELLATALHVVLVECEDRLKAERELVSTPESQGGTK